MCRKNVSVLVEPRALISGAEILLTNNIIICRCREVRAARRHLSHLRLPNPETRIFKNILQVRPNHSGTNPPLQTFRIAAKYIVKDIGDKILYLQCSLDDSKLKELREN